MIEEEELEDLVDDARATASELARCDDDKIRRGLWAEIAELPAEVLEGVVRAGLVARGSGCEEIIDFVDPGRAVRIAELAAVRGHGGLRAARVRESVELASYSARLVERAVRDLYKAGDHGNPSLLALLRYRRRRNPTSEGKRRGEGRKTRVLRDGILKLLAELPDVVSSRQVFYQCISAGLVENNKAECGRVLRLLVKMRRDRSIPYRRIVDRTRSKHHREGWESAEAILEACTDQFRRDCWSTQFTIPMIACEKAALEGVFAEVCDLYGVMLWTLRGFSSESFAFEWSEEIRALADKGKRIVVTYFGDHDPSGLAIEKDIREKLEGFGVDFDWTRGGLLPKDLRDFKLVRLPPKKSDTRAKSFLSKFAHAAELDALPPAELQRRIEAAITPHINREAWERVQREEKLQRADLEAVRKHWPIAVKAARAA